MVGRSLRSERCTEGHWGTPKAVSRIKLGAPSRECCQWLVIKEHLKKTSAVAQLSCEAMKPESMRCSSCDAKAENCVFPLRLNLYLDCVCLRMMLIVSGSYLGSAERLAGPARGWASLLAAAESTSLAVARSFDMEHLKLNSNYSCAVESHRFYHQNFQFC